MPNILVSLISEQTIPNFLILRHYIHKVDDFIFLTTQKMESNNINTSRSYWLAKTLGLDFYSINRIIIKDDDYFYNLEQLSNCIPENCDYILNITGGTKIMVLSCYDFFRQNRNLQKVIYLPINQQVIKRIFPDNNNEIITEKITIDEYLKVYGLNFKSEEPFLDFEDLKVIYKKYRYYNFDINKLNADYQNEHKNTFTGKWFEQYVYYLIKNQLNLTTDEIKYNIRIKYFQEFKEHLSDNEIDIAFVFQNRLHLVECKVSLGNRINENILLAINKLGSIKQNFGINCSSYIFTLSKLYNLQEMNRRANIGGIKRIFDREFFEKNENLQSFL